MARLSHVLRRSRRAAPAVAAAVPRAPSRRPAALEFLLVRTSNGERWTFPKGGVERGESMSAGRGARGARGGRRQRPRRRRAARRLSLRALAQRRTTTSRRSCWRSGATGCEAEPGREPTWLGFEAARSRLVQGREPGYGEAMERILRAAERAAARARRVK